MTSILRQTLLLFNIQIFWLWTLLDTVEHQCYPLLVSSSEMVFINFENCWNKKNHCTTKNSFYLFAMSPLAECYMGPKKNFIGEFVCIFKTHKTWTALVAVLSSAFMAEKGSWWLRGHSGAELCRCPVLFPENMLITKK